MHALVGYLVHLPAVAAHEFVTRGNLTSGFFDGSYYARVLGKGGNGTLVVSAGQPDSLFWDDVSEFRLLEPEPIHNQFNG